MSLPTSETELWLTGPRYPGVTRALQGRDPEVEKRCLQTLNTPWSDASAPTCRGGASAGQEAAPERAGWGGDGERRGQLQPYQGDGSSSGGPPHRSSDHRPWSTSTPGLAHTPRPWTTGAQVSTGVQTPGPLRPW